MTFGLNNRRTVATALALAFFTSGCASGGTAPGVRAAEVVEPSNLLGSYLIGRYAVGAHDAATAARFLGDAVRRDPNDLGVRREAMMAELLVGNYAQAAVDAAVIARRIKNDPVAPLILVANLMRHGDYAKVLTVLDGPPAKRGTMVLAPVMRAWAKQGLGDRKAALAEINTLKDKSDLDAFRLYHEALLAVLDHDDQRAEQAFDSLRAIGGAGWIRAVEAEGRFLEVTKPANAEAFYRAALKHYPGNPALIAGLVRLKAHETPKPLVADPADGFAEVMLGVATFLSQSKSGPHPGNRADAADPAVVYGRLALMARPNFPEVEALVADQFSDIGDTMQALTLYEAISPHSPLYRSAQIQAVTMLDRLGDDAQAMAKIADLEAQWPDDPTVPLAVAAIERRHDRTDKMIAAYTKALALMAPGDPAAWSIYFSRGLAQDEQKNYADADADLSRALKLKPDDPDVLNGLAYSWVEQGRNYEQAEAMIRKALKARPKSGYIIDSLGWVYYRQGKVKEAIPLLEKAVSLVPGEATITEHLGDAYWAVGRQSEARFQWRGALADKLTPDQAKILEHKLKHGLPGSASTP